MSATHFAYSFEAKSIQSFVLGSGKLRNMIGASELLESLWTTQLDEAIRVLNIEKPQFSRRAGGAFVALSTKENDLQRLQALWTLVIQHLAPGLQFVQALCSGTDFLSAAQNAQVTLLNGRNTQFVALPQAGPLVARNPRTGEPAVARSATDGMAVDLRTQRTQAFRHADGLISKLTPDMAEEICWPINLNSDDGEEDTNRAGSAVAFPFLGDNRYVGIVHADGNGLGQVLMKLMAHVKENAESRPRYQELFLAFSAALDTATVAAAKRATTNILLPEATKSRNIMPARPIVLGGDDLTMIVRGDLALEFTRCFIEHFENETERELIALREQFPGIPLPTRLTACAGVAFVKSSQPFQLAYALSESLCRHAKTASKKARRPASDGIPSSIAFHRITTSMIDEYDDIIRHELLRKHGDTTYRLTMQPYAVGRTETDQLPRFDNLKALVAQMASPAMSRGPTRRLLGLLSTDIGAAQNIYGRWREVLAERDSQCLEAFDSCMRELTGATATDTFNTLPFSPAHHDPSQMVTPLGDVLLINAVTGEQHVN